MLKLIAITGFLILSTPSAMGCDYDCGYDTSFYMDYSNSQQCPGFGDCGYSDYYLGGYGLGNYGSGGSGGYDIVVTEPSDYGYGYGDPFMSQPLMGGAPQVQNPMFAQPPVFSQPPFIPNPIGMFPPVMPTPQFQPPMMGAPLPPTNLPPPPTNIFPPPMAGPPSLPPAPAANAPYNIQQTRPRIHGTILRGVRR